MREHLVVLTVLLLMLGPASLPAAAQEIPLGGLHESVELVPAEGGSVTWDGRRFGGRLEVAARSGGLTVIEHVGPESYLTGIAEVPFDWPMEALRAQVVAARTYLAWTLSGGRSGAGRTYGFDICATDACQVYRGLDQLRRTGAARWEEAVRSTAGEILVYEGLPAQAMYSSTSGGRTMAVQDIFSGSDPIPYLQGAESPGEDSPFTTWTVELASWKLADVMRLAEYLVGPDIREAEVLQTESGQGPWRVRLLTGAGEVIMGVADFRRAMNRHGPDRHPDELPARRPDGARYPQTILSYLFSIREEIRTPPEFRPGYPLMERVFVIDGQGWGHHVGMSQYGARAMAEQGAGYGDILAHYYGGLRPQAAGDLLPAEVTVGLAWGFRSTSVSSEGPVTLMADGQPLVTGALGEWTFRHQDGLVVVEPPEGFGLPPTITELRPTDPTRAERAVVIRGILSTPSEVRLVVFRGPEVVATTDWRVYEAGSVVLVWNGIARGSPAGPGVYTVLVEGRSPSGAFHDFVSVPLLAP